MIRGAADVARGLAPAREARPIAPGERIHVVGAAGAGASAAALLAFEAGGAPDGCDPGAPTPYTVALEERGLAVATEHDAAHVSEAPPARLAVTKALTSVHPDHPELVAARVAGIPIEAWQQTVADAAAVQGGALVAIAGTHGKSTSAGWLVHVLVTAGRDPGAFVGALLPASLTRRYAGHRALGERPRLRGGGRRVRRQLRRLPAVAGGRAQCRVGPPRRVRGPQRGGGCVRDLAARARRGRAVASIINTGDAGGSALAERLVDWGDRLLTVAPADEAREPAWAIASAGRCSGSAACPGPTRRWWLRCGSRARTTRPTPPVSPLPPPPWACAGRRSPLGWLRSRVSAAGSTSRASTAGCSSSTTTGTTPRPSGPRSRRSAAATPAAACGSPTSR